MPGTRGQGGSLLLHCVISCWQPRPKIGVLDVACRAQPWAPLPGVLPAGAAGGDARAIRQQGAAGASQSRRCPGARTLNFRPEPHDPYVCQVDMQEAALAAQLQDKRGASGERWQLCVPVRSPNPFVFPCGDRSYFSSRCHKVMCPEALTRMLASPHADWKRLCAHARTDYLLQPWTEERVCTPAQGGRAAVEALMAQHELGAFLAAFGISRAALEGHAAAAHTRSANRRLRLGSLRLVRKARVSLAASAEGAAELSCVSSDRKRLCVTRCL